MRPEVFDAIIIVNIALGLLIAGRRFRRDIRGPLPEDAPHSFRDTMDFDATSASSESP